jgi:hypothetical protein
MTDERVFADLARPHSTFNDYVLQAVEMLARDRAGLGYDLHSYFTRNLSYGPDNPGAIKANHPPLTMCVAAVTETIIESLNIYFDVERDRTPFQKLPLISWQRGTINDIRAHIFQYDGTNCHGTAHALERFGIGQQLPFPSLIPGDFLTMNRTTGSGHTAIFLGYIDADYNDLTKYSDVVKGLGTSQLKEKKSAAALLFGGLFFLHFAPTNPLENRVIAILY